MEIKDIEVTGLKKGDICVVKFNHSIPKVACSLIKQELEDAITKAGFEKGDIIFLICENDIEFEIWRNNERIK